LFCTDRTKRRIARCAQSAGLIVTVLFAGGARADQPTPPAHFCAGSYADDFGALSAQAREFDRQPESVFSYCTRNTATYECLSYSLDGTVHHERRKAVLHGTAFAYKRQGDDTLLLTNDHVASWPVVTDSQHVVDGVPAGCKKVNEALALVDDEHDSYARDDITVTRVVTDPQLDVAVLKTQAKLQVMPWKIGHSARLRERNVVEVRGFPLGAFRATNAGTVISAHDHDDYGEWDHEDFVVDALLSSGNSGSPVLAVSCATGEYELVGIYHAGYSEGSALNVVVGIDQVRDLMTTLKRAARDRPDDLSSFDQRSRQTIADAVDAEHELFFPFGPQVAVERRGSDGALLIVLFSKDFPTSMDPVLVLEDLAPTADTPAGALGRVWLGSPQGLKPYDRTSLDADGQSQAARILDALRADALAHATYRGTRRVDAGSRQSSDDLRRLRKMLARNVGARVELLQNLGDLAERLAPQLGERGRTLAEVAPLLLRDGAAHPAIRVPLASAPVSGVAMPGLQRAR
jgi:S1-C subfamily serine protease